ncbi:hypothetical protein SDC9_136256 [bioreactor metagenome]|uniref:Uncharacterized protein n=1 Tax=bioreactor metagenome TaxID=1076179 RepID=A0A645DJC9_9ZZZZ
MPMRAISRESWPATGWPRNSTSPEVGVSTPEIWLNMVLLPAPLGPISARISPAFTSRLMLLLATSPPNLRVTFFASRIRSPFCGSARRASGVALASMTLRRALTGTKRVRMGHRPSRARCSTSTIIRPKKITSKLPLWPNTLGRMSCSHCLSTVITPAPTSAPQTWPAPPTTAMKRYSMPMCRPNGVGFTKRCMWA